jgi:hypothetical protein
MKNFNFITKPIGLLIAIIASVGFSLSAADEVIEDADLGLKFYLVNEKTCKISGYLDNMSANLVVPETVTLDGTEYTVVGIKGSAFKDCKTLETIELPSTATDFEASCFKACTSLKSVVLPEGTPIIRAEVFFGCSKLESVTIPESVTSIYGNAFSFCSALSSIRLPSALIKLDQTAFRECKSLTSVELPASLSTVGYNAFYLCTGLQDVIINACVKYNETFGTSCFYGCKNLKTVTFQGESSKNLTLGATMFKDCSSLETIILNTSQLPIAQANSFDTSHFESTQLQYSDELADAVKTTDVWMDFVNSGTTGLTTLTTDSGSFVSVDGNSIVISGYDGDVAVYAASGRKAYQGRAGRIALSTPGIYIVVMNDKNVKVTVR